MRPTISKLFVRRRSDPAAPGRWPPSTPTWPTDRRAALGLEAARDHHVMPVMARLFPEARCIHLVRDGRDVAFSPFLAPKAPFWRKIYFNDDRIYSWRGHPMTQRAYREHGHLFNAARWVNSVTLGRAHGAMLGERYLEVRYEALVADPVGRDERPWPRSSAWPPPA